MIKEIYIETPGKKREVIIYEDTNDIKKAAYRLSSLVDTYGNEGYSKMSLEDQCNYLADIDTLISYSNDREVILKCLFLLHKTHSL